MSPSINSFSKIICLGTLKSAPSGRVVNANFRAAAVEKRCQVDRGGGLGYPHRHV
jgi:hypothetical protein